MIQPHLSGGYILEELVVGMVAEKRVIVTEQRIQQFAEASDDFNPVHMDEAFASRTAYRGRIAHGLLSASFGSAVVGPSCRAPAQSIWVRPWPSTNRCGSATKSSPASPSRP